MTIGPDIPGYNQKVQEESKEITWDTIKGANQESSSVTAPLSLPDAVSSGDTYSTITWSSNNQAVEIGALDESTHTYPVTIHRPYPFTADAAVTLTAVFRAKIADQYTGLQNATVTFPLTVPQREAEDFTATFRVRTLDEQEVPGLKITVKDGEETLTPAGDGSSFAVKEGKTYSYEVAADGYTTRTGTFKPAENMEVSLTLYTESQTETADKKLDQILEVVDNKFYSPDRHVLDYKKDKNYATYLRDYLEKQTETPLDLSDVTISAEPYDSYETSVGENGEVLWGMMPDSQVVVRYSFTCNNVTKKSSQIHEFKLPDVDIEEYNAVTQAQFDKLNEMGFAFIRGNDTDTEEQVTCAPILYEYVNYEDDDYGTIEWTTDRPDILEIYRNRKINGYWANAVNVNFPESGEVTVHLTATLEPKVLYSQYEGFYRDEIKKYTKTYTLTITASPMSEEEMQKQLDSFVEEVVKRNGTEWPKSYVGASETGIWCSLSEEMAKNGKLTAEGAKGLIALEKTGFDSVSIYPDVLYPENEQKTETATTETVTFTYTVGKKKVTKDLNITINRKKADDAVALADQIGNYFTKELLDGQTADNVQKDLPVSYYYNLADRTHYSSWIKRDLKSDHPDIIAEESENGKLKVTIPEVTTEVTLTAYFSERKYEKYVQYFHQNDPVLGKLYMQKVTVRLTVPGTTSKKLVETIGRANEYYRSIAKEPEGTGVGCFPEGTKEKLYKAIDDARTMSKRKDATAEEVNACDEALNSLIQATKDSYHWAQIPVTVKAYDMPGQEGHIFNLTVSAGLSEKYGYSKVADKNQVTAQDAFIALQIRMYGEKDFAENPRQFLEIGGMSGKAQHGWVTKIFGIKTEDLGYCVNNKIPMYPDNPKMGSVADDTILKSGDLLSVFLYGDVEEWSDLYLYFDGAPSVVKADSDLTLTLVGMHPFQMTEEATARKGYTVNLISEDGEWLKGVTDEDGKVTFHVEKGGYYTANVTEKPEGMEDVHFVFPVENVTVEKAAEKVTVSSVTSLEDLKNLKITDGDKVLKEGRDYTVETSTSGFEMTVTIKFQGAYTGEITRTFLVPKDAAQLTVPEIGEQTDLKNLKITDGDTILKEGTDYRTEVTSAGHQVTVTITFLGNYTGEITRSYVTAHTFDHWTTTAEATVFAPERQEAVCPVCGTRQSREYGQALTPTVKVNAASIPLKVKQKTSLVKVSGLARGDEVVSWKSGNTKIVKVSQKGVITAQKKTGKTNITVTLKSGKTAVIRVSVQKSTVKTKKLTGLNKKVTLKKGASLTLKPERVPFTSGEKITYKSSNKKIVTVTGKGRLKAKKKGTATITVKSGKKTVKVKVTVK